MTWDIDKSTGDEIKSQDWDDMVTDQKTHNSRHEHDGSDNILSIGGSNTYIEVDEANDTITLYVNGSKVQEWS